jgi:hypothetical protein
MSEPQGWAELSRGRFRVQRNKTSDQTLTPICDVQLYTRPTGRVSSAVWKCNLGTVSPHSTAAFPSRGRTPTSSTNLSAEHECGSESGASGAGVGADTPTQPHLPLWELLSVAGLEARSRHDAVLLDNDRILVVSLVISC